MRNSSAQRLANRVAFISIGTMIVFFLVAALGDWEGLIGLALGLMLYFIALLHIPLGLTALISAFRTGDHVRNSWIYGYFGLFLLATIYYVGSVTDMDEVIEAAWEQFVDSDTASLRKAMGPNQFDEAAAKRAIDRGADVNLVGRHGRTPLMDAANKSNLELLKALLAAGAEVNAITSSGGTPLHYAAGGGTYHDSNPREFNVSTLVVAEILDAGANVHAIDNRGYTPILATCRTGSVEVATILVARGADVNVRSKDGITCLGLAVYNNHLGLVDWLLDHTGAESGEALMYAANSKNVSLFRKLLEQGADVRGLRGSILRLADDSRQDYTELLQLLLDSGRGKEAFAQSGYKELWEATTRGFNVGTIQNLLDLGASPNATGTASESMLHFITRTRDGERAIRILEVLISGGANPDAQNRQGETPLFFAVSRGNLETAQLLIRSGADVNVRSDSGRDLVAVAAGQGFGYMIEELIKSGYRLPAETAHGDYFTSAREHATSVSILLKHGFNPNVPDSRGFLPVFNTIKHRGAVNTVQALINGGVDLTQTDEKGYSVLTAVAHHGDIKLLDMLFAAGIDGNSKDANRRTPLDVCILRRNLSMILLLLNRGVKPTRMNVNAINNLIENDRNKGRYEDERTQLRTLMRGYQ